ncbi:MAG: hypothetical protein J6D03_05615 [Clostridia bacterium]|nr:hypothetical protein [Clostridia bacterium]
MSITATATQTMENSKESLLSQVNADNYGDSVDYSITLNEGKENEVTLDNWKIFSKDENNVYIIYGDYLPNIAVIASNLSISNQRKYAIYSSTSSEELLKGLVQTSNWEHLLTQGLKAKNVTAIGTPTLEQYVGSWNEKYPNDKLYTKKNSTEQYFIGLQVGSEATEINMSGAQGYNDTLYYPHKKSLNFVEGYWLSSFSGYTSIALMSVCYNGFVNFGYYYYQSRRSASCNFSTI